MVCHRYLWYIVFIWLFCKDFYAGSALEGRDIILFQPLSAWWAYRHRFARWTTGLLPGGWLWWFRIMFSCSRFVDLVVVLVALVMWLPLVSVVIWSCGGVSFRAKTFHRVCLDHVRLRTNAWNWPWLLVVATYFILVRLGNGRVSGGSCWCLLGFATTYLASLVASQEVRVDWLEKWSQLYTQLVLFRW